MPWFTNQRYFAQYISIILMIYVIIAFLHGQIVINDGADKNMNEFPDIMLKSHYSPTDQRHLQVIRDKFLRPPSIKPYNLRMNQKDLKSIRYISAVLVSNIYIKKILRKFYPEGLKKNGFFVEAGALDGEYASNSLFLELEWGWTGLLVEPDDQSYSRLIQKNRKAWSCKCCLSMKNYPYKTLLMRHSLTKLKKDEYIPLEAGDPMNSIVNGKNFQDRLGTIHYASFLSVQCFPIGSILQAINVSHVDVFSLDIEDGEKLVLEIFPWDSITVDVWIVEHRHKKSVNTFESDSVDPDFIRWFENKGYKLYDVAKHSPKDYIFLRNNSSVFNNNFDHMVFNRERTR